MRITRRGIAVAVAGALLAVVFSVVTGLLPPTLRVTRTVDPDRVMRGEPGQVTLEVTNKQSGLLKLGAITALGEDLCTGPGPRQRSVPIPLVRLRAGQTSTVVYPVPTERRGVLRLGPLRVGRPDPFGLVRSQRPVGASDEVHVYPYVHPIASVPAGWSRNPEGLAERAPHGSVAFDALREYVPGDDLRQIHWRTSARLGELMVRERVDTSLPRMVLLLDDRTAVHRDDTFEHACEAAASILSAAQRENVTVQLMLASGLNLRVPPQSGAYLDLLAEAELHDGVQLPAIADRIRQQQAGDLVVCLTGRPGPDDLAVLLALRDRFPSLVVGVFEAGTEFAVPGLTVLRATDGAEFARLWNGWTG